MQRAVILFLVASFGFGMLSTTSCLVTRQSERYTCDDDTDCKDGRTCDRGYCVTVAQAACPSPCTSCDLFDKTCRIECTGNRPCGNVQCPAGFDCTFKCSNGSACGNIDCAQSASCTIDCTGQASCGTINCGGQACDVTCSAPGSCGIVDCAASCKCDVNCNNASCPSMTCPQPGGLACSKDNGTIPVCDSSADQTCDTCL